MYRKKGRINVEKDEEVPMEELWSRNNVNKWKLEERKKERRKRK